MPPTPGPGSAVSGIPCAGWPESEVDVEAVDPLGTNGILPFMPGPPGVPAGGEPESFLGDGSGPYISSYTGIGSLSLEFVIPFSSVL